MMYPAFVAEARVGDTIRFVYHGKVREGVVERITRPLVVVRFMDDNKPYYRSFHYYKITGLKNLSVA
jgi:hypothetical protein